MPTRRDWSNHQVFAPTTAEDVEDAVRHLTAEAFNGMLDVQQGARSPMLLATAGICAYGAAGMMALERDAAVTPEEVERVRRMHDRAMKVVQDVLTRILQQLADGTAAVAPASGLARLVAALHDATVELSTEMSTAAQEGAQVVSLGKDGDA